MPLPRRQESLLESLLTGTGATELRATTGKPYELRSYTGKVRGYQLVVLGSTDGNTFAYSAQLKRADGTTSFSKQEQDLSEELYTEQLEKLIDELARLGMVDPASEKIERLLEK